MKLFARRCNSRYHREERFKLKFLKRVLLIIVAVLVLLLTWGIVVEPRLIDVKEEMAKIPQLPAAWEGARVALIADLQVGMWLNNTDTARRIVGRLVEERPALVLIAGDFVYKPLGEETKEETRDELEEEDYREAGEVIGKVTDMLRPLVAAGIPTYAVLGNHDYGMMTPHDLKQEWLARLLRQSLEGAGVRVLDNAAAALPSPAARPNGSQAETTTGEPPLYVVGIGSHFAQHDNPAVALSQVPTKAPRLVFMHNPDSFIQLPAGAAPLALAGHTHGGQIRIPFTPEWSWPSLVSDNQIHGDGWIDGYGQPGNRLYVNRGIGFSYVPIRINCPPELTMFTLRRAN